MQKGRTTGFFHVEKINGKFWLVDTKGNLFISKGVNYVNYQADIVPKLGYSPYNKIVSGKYGSADTWAEIAVKRLRSWGFNTIGAWSSEETFTKGMPYTVILNIASSAGSDWLSGEVTDYFSRKFEKTADDVARKVCTSRKHDPNLLGYFTDNELRWTADWRTKKELFDDYMLLRSENEGKKALIKFLEHKYVRISTLNKAWNTSFSSFDDLLCLYEVPESEALKTDRLGFLKLVSTRYFKVCHNAIKKYDSNHLNLGCRYAFKPPDEAMRACLGYVDIFSVNRYTNPYSNDLRKVLKSLDEIHDVLALPIMIGEFSFKAMDSGLPNTKGAGIPVKTQEERANYYEEYVRAILLKPFVVGYHWFEHADEPAEGRFDGENSNYGLVNINDEPWTILIDKARAVNLQAESIHTNGSKD